MSQIMDNDNCVFGVTRSLSGRAWRFRPAEERHVMAMSQRHGLPEVVARLLVARGIDPDAAADYLAPTLRALMPDPYIIADMAVAAERVARAIRSGEAVAVFGDYDVDGATSSALLKRFFDSVGGRLRVYIPDRMAEGYGPNIPALLRLKDEGVSLVVTVDCGALAFEPLAAARAAGLDVVVVDHHLCEPALPQAVAVVNPNRLDDDSGLGHLAAVGVAFLLLIAVNRLLRDSGWYGPDRPEPPLLDYLDMVALGTVADVVPLTGLNRALVAQGIKVMGQGRNCGLRALMKVARMTEPPGAYHLGFLLGPRVNAGGRVGRADLGARILATDDDGLAETLAAELDRHNAERQAIEAMVLDEAMLQLQARHGGEPAGPLALAAAEGWHAGVIGIVAGRIKERFDLPAIVIALDGDVGKGSARSIPGVDIGAAVTAARQAGLLINGGGHKMAAGLTVARDRLGDLEAFLAERLAGAMAARTERALVLDGALTVPACSQDLVDRIATAGPFGAGNPTPRFAFSQLKVAYADVVGSDHVRATFEASCGTRIKGIAFRTAATPLGQRLLGGIGSRVHVAGSLRVNFWNGRRSVEMQIEDVADG